MGGQCCGTPADGQSSQYIACTRPSPPSRTQSHDSSGLDKHTQLAAASPDDTQVIIQVQRLKGGSSLLPGGPQIAWQLGQGELWQAAQQASNASCA